jgi:hypothetical protein
MVHYCALSTTSLKLSQLGFFFPVFPNEIRELRHFIIILSNMG